MVGYFAANTPVAASLETEMNFLSPTGVYSSLNPPHVNFTNLTITVTFSQQQLNVLH